MSLMSTLDIMDGEIEFADAKEQLTELIVNVAIVLNGDNDEDELDDSHLQGLANAYLQFAGEEDLIGGEKAEKIFSKAYRKEYKAVLGRCDEDDVWCNIYFARVSLPKNLIVRIANACGRKAALDTKAWYDYCKARHEEDPSTFAPK